MSRKRATPKIRRHYIDVNGTCPKWPAVTGLDGDIPSQSRSPKPGDVYAGNSLPLDSPLRFDQRASRSPRDFADAPEAMKMGGKSKFRTGESITPVFLGPGNPSCGELAQASQEAQRLRHVIDRDPIDNPLPDAEDYS